MIVQSIADVYYNRACQYAIHSDINLHHLPSTQL